MDEDDRLYLTVRFLAAVGGLVGGAIGGTIVIVLLIIAVRSTFGLTNIWPGTAAGAVIGMVLGFLFPRIGKTLFDHDLRRHSATYASRNGVPLEVISKVILRHSDLKTAQMYLCKVTDAEAIRWVDVLHSK
jgi:hypothetical protein